MEKPAPPDESALMRLRENARLRLDREGRWWHEGQPVEHPRVAALFHRGLGRAPDGRYTLTVGPQWCFVEVEDAPYVVRAARLDDAGAALTLSDASVERLDPATLTLGADGALRCLVKAGAMPARFSRQAQLALADALGDEGGRLTLALGGARWDVPR